MFDNALDMSRVLNMPASWIYQGTVVLNIPGLWICQCSEYASGSEYGRILDIQKVLNIHKTINTNSNINSFMIYAKLHRVLIMTEYAWIILEYIWLCLPIVFFFYINMLHDTNLYKLKANIKYIY